jgi:hypothetical protein
MAKATVEELDKAQFGRVLHERARAEDATRCIEVVKSRPSTVIFRQCKRYRGYGPNGDFCKLHANRRSHPTNTGSVT